MNEFENLKKAYERLEKIHKEEHEKYLEMKIKLKRNIVKRKEFEQLVEAHIRLNKELTEKLKKAEIDLASMLKRQETGKKSTQTNKKGSVNKIH